jgi:hypothetical protein
MGNSGVKEMTSLYSNICNREGNGTVPECNSRWTSPPAMGTISFAMIGRFLPPICKLVVSVSILYNGSHRSLAYP